MTLPRASMTGCLTGSTSRSCSRRSRNVPASWLIATSTTGPRSRHPHRRCRTPDVPHRIYRCSRREFSMHECLRVYSSYRNDPDHALDLCAHRRPATSAIVPANRGLGPEMPMRLVHERAPEVSTTSTMSSAPKKFSRSPTAIDEPLACRSPQAVCHLSTATCRDAAVTSRRYPPIAPNASHSSSVHGARNWVVTKSDVHRTMSIQGRSALITW